MSKPAPKPALPQAASETAAPATDSTEPGEIISERLYAGQSAAFSLADLLERIREAARSGTDGEMLGALVECCCFFTEEAGGHAIQRVLPELADARASPPVFTWHGSAACIALSEETAAGALLWLTSEAVLTSINLHGVGEFLHELGKNITISPGVAPGVDSLAISGLVRKVVDDNGQSSSLEPFRAVVDTYHCLCSSGRLRPKQLRERLRSQLADFDYNAMARELKGEFAKAIRDKKRHLETTNAIKTAVAEALRSNLVGDVGLAWLPTSNDGSVPPIEPASNPGSSEPLEGNQQVCYFVRIGVGKETRYKIRFLTEEDTLTGYKGFRMVEFLLKQPGTRASGLDFDRVCAADPSQGRYVDAGEIAWDETEGDGSMGAGYNRDDIHTEEPADIETISQLKEDLEKHQQWLVEAENLHDEKRMKQEEEEVRALTDYIRKEERSQRRSQRGRLAPDCSAERARKRWAWNLNYAIDKLQDAEMPKLAQFLKDHIKPDSGGRKYVPDPGTEWRFTEAR